MHVDSDGLDCKSCSPTSNIVSALLTRLQIIGAVLQCTSYSVPQIMIARYVTGVGTGIETSTVPMYQSELCDAKRRGRLVSSEPLFVGVGIVSALIGIMICGMLIAAGHRVLLRLWYEFCPWFCSMARTNCLSNRLRFGEYLYQSNDSRKSLLTSN